MDETGWNRSLDLDSVRCLLRHRRWRIRDWVGFCLPVSLVLIVAWLHFSSPPPAISLANYERIQIGMTSDEVDGIIRARPGTYA